MNVDAFLDVVGQVEMRIVEEIVVRVLLRVGRTRCKESVMLIAKSRSTELRR